HAVFIREIVFIISKNQIPFLIRSEFPDQVLHLVDVTYMMKRQGFQLLAEHDEMDMCIRESRQHRLTVEVRSKSASASSSLRLPVPTTRPLSPRTASTVSPSRFIVYMVPL